MVEMDDKLIPNAILAWLYANGGKSEATDYIEKTFEVSEESAEAANISASSLKVVYDRNLQRKHENIYQAAEADKSRIKKQEINNLAAEKNLSNTRKLRKLESNIKNDYNMIRNYASNQGEIRKKKLLKQKYFSKKLTPKNTANINTTRKRALLDKIGLLSKDKQEKYLEYLNLKKEVIYKEIDKLTPEIVRGQFMGSYDIPNYTPPRTPENQKKVDILFAEVRELSHQLDTLKNSKKNSPGGN